MFRDCYCTSGLPEAKRTREGKKAYPEKSIKRILTGGKKEIKREKKDKPKISTTDKKKKKEEEEIKEKIRESSGGMVSIL